MSIRYKDQIVANVSSSSSETPGGVIQWEDINGKPDLSNVSNLTCVSVTLQAILWSDTKEIEVSIPSISANEAEQIITPIPKSSSRQSYYENNILLSEQNEGHLIFKTQSIPTNDIEVYVYIQSVVELAEDIVGTFEWWSPKMTSDNTPSPFVASASSVQQVTPNYFPEYLAFDGTPAIDGYGTGGVWLSADAVGTAWIQLDTGVKTVIDGLRISPAYARSTIETAPNFLLKGSLDGNTWNDIGNWSNITWGRVDEYQEFMLDKPVVYRFYRIEASAKLIETYNGRVGYGDIQFHVLTN